MPSTSALVYLFGDLFAERTPLLGVDLPWREARVNEHDLTTKMFLAEFVTLMETGVLHLQRAQSGRPFEQMRVTIHVTLIRDQGEQRGLTACILTSIRGWKGKGREPIGVRDIVWGVLGKDCLDPWECAFEPACQELLQSGYFEVEEHRGLWKTLSGRYHPILDRIATLEGEAKELGDRLETFERYDSELYALLQQEVQEGLWARQEIPDL